MSKCLVLDGESPFVDVGEDDRLIVRKCACENDLELTEVRFASGIVRIEAHAFRGCKNLQTVIFSATVCDIGCGAFDGCISLKSFCAPPDLHSIDDYAFRGCTSLATVSGLFSGMEFGIGVFDACPRLSGVPIMDGTILLTMPEASGDVELPRGISNIGMYAFSGNSKIRSVVIPDSVVSIGECAFDDCSELRDVKMSDSITSFAES